MTSRERVLTALDHHVPDRVPLHVDFTPEAAHVIARHLGLVNAAAEAYSGEVSELPLALGHDLLVAWHGIATSYYLHDGEGEYTCPWGIRWRWVRNPSGRYTEMVGLPLTDERALDSYKCPDPDAPGIYNAVTELTARYGATHAIVGAMPCTLFETAWYLRGFEDFLADLAVNRDFAHRLLDMLLAYQMVVGTRLAEKGMDIIWMGDDFGTQGSLIVSPATWREFFKPRYASLIERFRAVNPVVRIAYHSCGNIEPLLDEYIDIGVDILNAVQPLAMDTARLKKRYGDRLSFWGAIDIQHTMPFGTPADVEREVKERIETLGTGGGYIIGPAHNIQADVPLDNILALYRAVDIYGWY